MRILLLFGISGVGKTTISKEIKKRLTLLGYKCKFIDYNYFRDHIIKLAIKEGLISRYDENNLHLVVKLYTKLGSLKFLKLYLKSLKHLIEKEETNLDVLIISCHAFVRFSNTYRPAISPEFATLLANKDILLILIETSSKDLICFRKKSKKLNCLLGQKPIDENLINNEFIYERFGISLLSYFASKPFTVLYNKKGEISKVVEEIINLMDII